MSKYVKEKKIKVVSFGWIDMIGVIGPVLTPFKCDIKKIMHMINTGKDVIEVLDDGTELKLTLSNYELDNNKIKIKEKINQASILDNNQSQQKNETANDSTNINVSDNNKVQQASQTADISENNTTSDVTTNKVYNNNNKKNK